MEFLVTGNWQGANGPLDGDVGSHYGVTGKATINGPVTRMVWPRHDMVRSGDERSASGTRRHTPTQGIEPPSQGSAGRFTLCVRTVFSARGAERTLTGRQAPAFYLGGKSILRPKHRTIIQPTAQPANAI